MSNSRSEFISYLENVSLFLLGILFFAFPLIFTSITTDAFAIPKQFLLIALVAIAVLLFGVKAVVEMKIKFRSTPFDLPVGLFAVVLLASSLMAVNKIDALTAYVPVLFAILAYFVIVNTVKNENSLLFLLFAFVLGAMGSALLTVFSFFKIYPLPFEYSHNMAFTTFGSLLDQAIYLALVLPIAGYFAYSLLTSVNRRGDHSPFRQQEDSGIKSKAIFFSIGFIVIGLGLLFTVYMLLTTQKPLILPFETGFQTAFAAISQDAGHWMGIFFGFLFGSGFGTYVTDFTRFKQVAYNANPTLWSFTFFRSSSFVLELLATTGVLGLFAFIFIVYRVVKEKSFFLPVILAIVAAFLLPFSFTLIALFFMLLGIFAVVRAHQNPKRYPDLELYMVAVRHGLFRALPENHLSHEEKEVRHDAEKGGATWVFPLIMLVILFGFVGTVGFFASRFFFSDLDFQKSLVAASQNNGLQTYQLEQKALQQFPQRDSYWRTFSQVNLALANSLAQSQPKDASPSAQVQQQILNLIQQSIAAGRQAITVSPQTSSNWVNLSSIYRSLIGFGQNADRFSLLTMQQAIQLDPNNPQLFINAGGIYYQLGLWDDAARQFQTAINNKPDFANAWYNLGHTFEAKGDLQNALTAYQTVKTLVASDPQNAKKISAEIDALQKKIGEQAKTAKSQVEANAQNQPDLDVNKPEAQLPERNPKVQIPGPSASPTPAKKTTDKVTPTPAANQQTNQ